MNKSTKRGIGFGVTSGIITTLGLLVGLYSSTKSKIIVIAGVIFIIIADAFSDALGMHISEESSSKVSHKFVWKSTFATFLSKLFIAGIFLIPLLLFELQLAVLVCVGLGIFMLGFFSYKIAISRKENPLKTIFQHVGIAILVIVVTYFIGEFVGSL